MITGCAVPVKPESAMLCTVDVAVNWYHISRPLTAGLAHDAAATVDAVAAVKDAVVADVQAEPLFTVSVVALAQLSLGGATKTSLGTYFEKALY